LEALIESKPGCSLLKIEIPTWQAAVVQQFGIRSLPTVWLYKDGKQLTADTRDALTRLNQID
jgi:thioredoxin-like negative regulator of GroEL